MMQGAMKRFGTAMAAFATAAVAVSTGVAAPGASLRVKAASGLALGKSTGTHTNKNAATC